MVISVELKMAKDFNFNLEVLTNHSCGLVNSFSNMAGQECRGVETEDSVLTT